jgi:hypothetical protein
MLVYHIDPMGYTTIDGKRIYGECFNYGAFGPAEITYKQFSKNKKILKEQPVTDSWLEKKFGKKFPSIQFKITEMWRVDFEKLIDIARLIGIDYRKPRHPTSMDKRALRKAVLSRIDRVVR